MARTPVLPEANQVGPVSALLRRSLFVRRRTALDPLLPHSTGPMKGREAPESGLCQKAWVARKGDIEFALC
jgi:hypothetical protein